jgi:hypothetical protein
VQRRSCVLAALCLLVAASSCFVATSSAIAKHRSSVVAKHKPVDGKKHKSLAAGQTRKSLLSKKRKLSVAVKEEPLFVLTPRTPADKHDCIATAQAFYARAVALSRRTKQTIPQEFERVISKLDEFCGEEEFEKARISIDWMDACLQNFTNKTEFCSSSGHCVEDSKSDACVVEGRAKGN